MLIGIDASRAFLKNRTGVEEYSYQVIKHLRDRLSDDQACPPMRRIVLYIRKNQEVDFNLPAGEAGLPENWKIKVIKFPYFWTQLGLSLELLLHPADILFIPAHTVPFIHPANTVVAVHGLEYEIFPRGYSFWARLYMRLSIKMSCQWAFRIIAVSNNTKNDLVKLYGINENKIRVIYEGYNRNFKFQISSAAADKSNSNEQILKPYLLFIGRIEARKNIDGILKAYEILIEKYNISHTLVLAGVPGYGYDIIKLKIQNYLKIQNSKLKIIELGYINEAQKWQLLSGAEIFLFPTLYEGFGIPVLEAQSVGVPVVAGNNSSIPEVAGNSALLIDPNNAEQIADAAYRLISDKDLRDDIIKKGLENVKRFSWEKCASKIAEILTK